MGMAVKNKGFSLMELMLVIVIIGMMMVAALTAFQRKMMNVRMDRVSLQTQQFLNAGLSYYVKNGSWPWDKTNPKKLSELILFESGFLPGSDIKNPWGKSYGMKPATFKAGVGSDKAVFSVWTDVGDHGTAQIIAGKLPLSCVVMIDKKAKPESEAPVCSTDAKATGVKSSVNLPGQNLNTATGFNFAGIYHVGACVPAPNCPDGPGGKPMKAEIYVVPAKFTGVETEEEKRYLSPLLSVTAYAVGEVDKSKPGRAGFKGAPVATDPGPASCFLNDSGLRIPEICKSEELPASQNVWRVCMNVITEAGGDSKKPSDADIANMGLIMAMTRCAVDGEQKGGSKDSGTPIWNG